MRDISVDFLYKIKYEKNVMKIDFKYKQIQKKQKTCELCCLEVNKWSLCWSLVQVESSHERLKFKIQRRTLSAPLFNATKQTHRCSVIF